METQLIWRVRLLVGFIATLLLLSLSGCGASDPYNSGDSVVVVHHHHSVMHHTVVHHVVTHKVRRSLSLHKR
jgi:hypothetical protein